MYKIILKTAVSNIFSLNEVLNSSLFQQKLISQSVWSVAQIWTLNNCKVIAKEEHIIQYKMYLKTL